GSAVCLHEMPTGRANHAEFPSFNLSSERRATLQGAQQQKTGGIIEKHPVRRNRLRIISLTTELPEICAKPAL
ncbi:MAG: hypothetical protein E6556_14255, partial [Pantoea sp.]|nr:hypothetical protein [Pantoea sp.]